MSKRSSVALLAIIKIDSNKRNAIKFKSKGKIKGKKLLLHEQLTAKTPGVEDKPTTAVIKGRLM